MARVLWSLNGNAANHDISASVIGLLTIINRKLRANEMESWQLKDKTHNPGGRTLFAIRRPPVRKKGPDTVSKKTVGIRPVAGNSVWRPDAAGDRRLERDQAHAQDHRGTSHSPAA